MLEKLRNTEKVGIFVKNVVKRENWEKELITMHIIIVEMVQKW